MESGSAAGGVTAAPQAFSVAGTMVRLSRPPFDRLPASAPVQPGPRWGGDVEPRPLVGPFRRWPRVSDAALSVVVFVASLIAAAFSRVDDGEDFSLSSVAELPVAAYVIVAAAAGALCWRRRHAIPVASLILAALWLWSILDYGESPVLAMTVALYSIGRYLPDGWRSITIVVTAFVTATITGAEDLGHGLELGGALVFAILPWYIGRRVRTRGDYLAMLQDRAMQLERERDAEARRAVADERSRIARELHDVVAHRVSLMTVQAGAAKTVARDDIDGAIEAMSDVEQAGRQALGELRHLLGVLRPEGSSPDGLGPQAGLADLAALVDRLGDTGTHVSLTIDAQLPDHLPAALDLSAYRIVQESLTNVVKHAGPDPVVDVRVAVRGDALEIEITNSTTRETSGLPGSGYGIVGMRERAHLLGGTLTAGQRSGDGFAVTALIPLEPEATR